MLVHAVYNGKVYWGESWGANTRVASISSFASQYAESGNTYHFDGAVSFGYKEGSTAFFEKCKDRTKAEITVSVTTSGQKISSLPFNPASELSKTYSNSYISSEVPVGSKLNVSEIIENNVAGHYWYHVNYNENGKNIDGWFYAPYCDGIVNTLHEIGEYSKVADIAAQVSISDEFYRKNPHTLYSEPYADAAVKRNVSVGDTYTTQAVYKNKYGNYWLKLKNGGYICANEVKLVTQVSAPTASGLVYPTGNLAKGQKFNLEGTVSSKSLMTKVHAKVTYQSNGTNALPEASVTNVTSLSILNSNINISSRGGLSFGELNRGDYYYTLSADYYVYRNVSNSSDNPLTTATVDLVRRAPFTVDGGSGQPVKIPVEEISIDYYGELYLNDQVLDWLVVGDTAEIYANAYPYDATNQNLTWTSTDSNIGTISNNILYVKGYGTCILTVSANDGSGVKASFTLEVNRAESSAIINMPVYVSLPLGTLQTITATTDSGAGVIWWSGDSSMVRVNSDGCIVGCKPGTTYIYAEAKDNPNVIENCSVTVRTPDASSISDIFSGQQWSCEISGTERTRVYRFVPPTSMYYVFESRYDYHDTYGYIYDHNWNCIAYDDDSAGDGHFRITAYLTAGETYYLVGRLYDVFSDDILTIGIDPLYLEIINEPESVEVEPDTDAVFVVDVNGYNPNYQWQYRAPSAKTWTNTTANGAKTNTLVIPGTLSRNGYSYRCVITDASSTQIITDEVTLTVHVDLGITTQPTNQSVAEGANAKFAVTASGNGLQYQWQYRASSSASWTNTTATGAKTATLTIPATASRNGYQYRCIITDKTGANVTSSTVTLTVQVPLQITGQPANQTVEVGSNAKFSVNASGIGLQYQWQYRATSASGWTNTTATGAKTATLTIPATASRNGYQYQCVITDQTGTSVTSSTATLTVRVPLQITQQPANRTVEIGENANFTVKTDGSGLKYQWQYRASSTGNWTNTTATGAQTATLTIPGTTSRNGYQYRCTVSDQSGTSMTSAAATLTVNIPLVIVTQPANQKVEEGKTAKFTLKVNGNGLQYQWQYKASSGGSWSSTTATGAKTATLTIPGTLSRNGYQYRCLITDQTGESVFSTVVILTVEAVKPQEATYVRMENETETVEIGLLRKLTAVTDGEAGVSWYSGDTNIVKVNSDGSIVGCKPGTANVYAAAADNSDISASCIVTVTKPSESRIDNIYEKEQWSRWVSGEDRMMILKFTPTTTGYFVFDSDYEDNPDTYGYIFDENWKCLRYDDNSAGDGHFRIVHNMTAGKAYYLVGRHNNVFNDDDLLYSIDAFKPEIISDPVSVEVMPDTNAQFHVEMKGYKPSYQWQYRASSNGSWSNTTATGYKTDTLTVPGTVSRDGYQYRCVITEENGTQYISDAATLTVHIDFAIKTHPVNQSVAEGQNAKFSVTATGNGLQYQWQYRTSSADKWLNTTATGAKTAMLTVPATVSRNNYQYRCVITDRNGETVTSNEATLKVLVEFEITTQPTSKTVTDGMEAKFTVAASGTGLKYQWQYRTSSGGTWTNATETDATAATLTVPATTEKNGYQYRCVITNPLGNKLTSFTATLNVQKELKIVTQPVDQTVVDGAEAKFTVSASGEELKYDWQYRTSTTDAWQSPRTVGSDSDTYSIIARAAQSGFQFRCVITDKYNNQVISDIVTLTVQAELKIEQQPSSQKGIAGENAVFTVKAAGDALKYQWQYKAPSATTWTKTTATGATTASLTIEVTAAKKGYQYRCVITDKYGKSINSDPATLQIPVDLKITAQPADKTVADGTIAKFTVKAEGDGLKYQWQYRASSSGTWSNTSATGATTATLSVSATTAKNGYQYRCIIKDQYGNSVTSSAATMTLPVELKITAQPANKTVTAGTEAKFTVKAIGNGLKYQWYYRASSTASWTKTTATGATTATLTIPGTASRNGYQYCCEITDQSGDKVTSNAVKLTVQ